MRSERYNVINGLAYWRVATLIVVNSLFIILSIVTQLCLCGSVYVYVCGYACVYVWVKWVRMTNIYKNMIVVLKCRVFKVLDYIEIT